MFSFLRIVKSLNDLNTIHKDDFVELSFLLFSLVRPKCYKHNVRYQRHQVHFSNSSSTTKSRYFAPEEIWRQSRYAVVCYSSLSIDLDRRCIECVLFVPERSLWPEAPNIGADHCPVCPVSTVQRTASGVDQRRPDYQVTLSCLTEIHCYDKPLSLKREALLYYLLLYYLVCR